MIQGSTEYHCKLDEKGRLPIPSKLRKNLGESFEQGFFVKRSIFFSALELFPNDEWEKEKQRLSGLSLLKEANVRFLMAYTSGEDLQIDGAGRIKIPKVLMDFAGMTNKQEVVIQVVVNRMYVWDKAKWEEEQNKSIDELPNLANQVDEELKNTNKG
ncbi:MAG: hypothetical protein K9I94_01030 [Bacteroidales bacterium]|nr:hypothetical protein [Bacteroidales bacterium]